MRAGVYDREVQRSQPVTVRPAREEDAEAVARIVVDGLGRKYRPALGQAAVRGIAALVRRDAGGGASRHLVAELDGRLAGTVHLTLAGGEAATGFGRALAEEVGWAAALRATLVLGLLGHDGIGPDEAYIDELAVARWARRRGVARALLGACVAESRRAGRHRLTLWVTTDNGPARALYADAGFRETRRRRWIAGRILFGSPGASLMALPLSPGA